MTDGYRITRVAAADCKLVDAPWSFAAERADEIDRYWLQRSSEQPDMFNGRVLMLRDGAIADKHSETVFLGSFIETNFKAFLFWRELGAPTTGARNCFAMAAIETADDAFVLGEMAPHTAPAGQIYFPSGTPDQHDVVGHAVDLDGSARRELQEETGLSVDDVHIAPGFVLVENAARVCCMKAVRSPESAEALVARIHGWLAHDPKPELARMHIVRRPADFLPAMPDFVTAYLACMFASR